jgi:hypothetical protein
LLEWGIVLGFAAIPALAGQLWRLRKRGLTA